VFYDQSEFRVRCEWGLAGLLHLGPSLVSGDAVVIVDVLSFSTCVDVAVSRGASVVPHEWKDASARARAEELGALLAESRDHARGDAGAFSLSPASLLGLPPGACLVLPSPNGATLSRRAATLGPSVYTACLRNASAVASHVNRCHTNILLVPAGERWADGTLRPALEDWLGCGAVADALGPLALSPEAVGARDAFRAVRGDLRRVLGDLASGRELRERGFSADLALAAELDASASVPGLSEARYRDAITQR
jgi:2-phosphosulfolactate phosphatase